MFYSGHSCPLCSHSFSHSVKIREVIFIPYHVPLTSTAIFAGGTIRSLGGLIDTYFSIFSFSTKTWTDFLKTNYCLPSLELSIPFFPEVTANDLPS